MANGVCHPYVHGKATHLYNNIKIVYLRGFSYLVESSAKYSSSHLDSAGRP